MLARQRYLLLGLLLLGLVGWRVLPGWQQNKAAVATVAHLSLSGSCAPDAPRLQWEGGDIPTHLSPYLQIVTASAEGSGGEFVTFTPDEWQRDGRLLAWFRGQQWLKLEQPEHAFLAMQPAEPGHHLLARGHATYSRDHYCTLFNWLLAHELGGVGPNPDPSSASIYPYARSLIATGQSEPVMRAMEALLLWQPQQPEWRLLLAEAYGAQNRPADVRQVVAPLIGSETYGAEAQRLLERYPEP